MRASLAAFDMPLIVLDPTLPMSWDYYAGLLVDLVLSIDMLLKGS